MLSLAGQSEFWPRGSLFTDLSETLCDQVSPTHVILVRWSTVSGGWERGAQWVSLRHSREYHLPYSRVWCSSDELCKTSVTLTRSLWGYLQTLLPEILRHTPAGTSARTLQHFAQGVNSGRYSTVMLNNEHAPHHLSRQVHHVWPGKQESKLCCLWFTCTARVPPVYGNTGWLLTF